MTDKKKQKKTIVKKKATKGGGHRGNLGSTIAKANVVVNIGGRGGKSQPRKKKTMIKGTPEEFRKSSGYILPQYPQPTIIQPPPNTVQYLPAPTTNQYLMGVGKPTVSPTTPSLPYFITEGGSEGGGVRGGEAPLIEDVSQPENIKAPSIPKIGTNRIGGNIAKSEEEKIQISRDKLMNYGFPERIANKGTLGRDTDIDAVVEIMYNANKNQNANITASDLYRVYGIDGGSVKKRLENITGIKQIGRRKSVSKIPTLEEYNLV